MYPQICPNGHETADSDFCSVCGVKVQPGSRAPVLPTVGVGEPCPDCGAPRDAQGGPFCEVCGFNFSTGAHGELKPADPESTPAAEDSPPVAVQSPSEWQIEVTVDPNLRAAESPEPPADFAPIVCKIDKPSSLIGRTSEKRGVLPEISLDRDDAVSHRHALLNLSPAGDLVLRDIGSSNGTRLNGAEIQPMTDAPLKNGDEFTLGHWTRIRVRGIV